MIPSVMPSQRYSASGSPAALVRGSTAIDSIAGPWLPEDEDAGAAEPLETSFR